MLPWHQGIAGLFETTYIPKWKSRSVVKIEFNFWSGKLFLSVSISISISSMYLYLYHLHVSLAYEYQTISLYFYIFPQNSLHYLLIFKLLILNFVDLFTLRCYLYETYCLIHKNFFAHQSICRMNIWVYCFWMRFFSLLSFTHAWI